MEPSAETAILFSALQLADTYLEGGLKGVKMLDFVDNPNFENNWLKTRHDGSIEVIKVLSETINEIVSGVEFNFSKFEQDHWKFQITTILLMLAMRETIEELAEQQLEILESFPDISLDLAVKLIGECDLEIALIDVLQNLNLTMNLTIVSKMISNFNALIDSGVPKAEISAEFGAIFNSIIGYTFIHSSGILMKSLTCENLETMTEVIEKLIDLVLTMSRDSFFDVSENEKVSSVNNTYPYIVAAFVGFLNYSCFLECGAFAHVNILAIYMKEGDMFLWPNISTEKPHEKNINRILEVIGSYSFEFLDDSEVLLDMFETSTRKSLMTTTGHCPPKSTNEVLNRLLNWLNNFHSESPITNYLASFLGYSKAIENVKDAHKTKWGYSCSSKFLLLKIQKLILDKNVKEGKSLGNYEDDIYQKLGGVFEHPVLKQALQNKCMNSKQLKEKNMFVVGERMEGYESAFTWLLDCIWFNISHIDTKWLKCMNENMDLLVKKDNVQSLLNLSLKIQPSTIQDVENIKHVKELFVSAFTKLTVCEQNDVLEVAYLKIDDPREFFQTEQNGSKMKLTAFLNRLTGSSFGVSDNIAKEFALLALQDPITLLDEILTSVLRNQKQCDLMVGIMAKVPAIASFSHQREDYESSSYLSLSLKNTILNVDNYSHKEIENLLKFIKLLLKAPFTDSGAVNLLDKQQFLLTNVLPMLTTLVDEHSQNRSIGKLALKVFIAIIQSLIDDKRSWKEVIMINPVIMMDCVCQYLDEIDSRLNIETIGMLASVKSSLIKGVHALEDLMDQHILELSQKEMTWLYCRLNKLSNYYIIGYLMPLFWKFADLRNVQEGFVMCIPQCLKKFLCLPKLTTHFKWMTEKPDFIFSSGETLLKLCMVSDAVCEKVLSMLKKDECLWEQFGWIAVLFKVLPLGLSEEWDRVNSALFHVNLFSLQKSHTAQPSVKDGNTETSNFDNVEVNAQNNIQILLLDTLCVLYDMDVILGNPNLESVLLKGFTTVYGQKGIQCLRNAVLCSKKGQNSCSVKIICANVCKLCLLFDKISLTMHDQVVGILLEVIDCYNETIDCLASNEASSGGNKMFRKEVSNFKIENVLSSLPDDVKKVAFKKLKCI